MAEGVKQIQSGDITPLLGANGVLVTGAGPWTYKGAQNCAFQFTVGGTGAVAATITIQVSNDGVNPLDTVLGTATLSGTALDSDGFICIEAAWKFVRANVTAISGTGATAQCLMSS